MSIVDTGIQLLYQFTDGLGRGLQENLQMGVVIEEARPQQVAGGAGDAEVGDFGFQALVAPVIPMVTEYARCKQHVR